jgi:predicted Na+-dependent transporter
MLKLRKSAKQIKQNFIPSNLFLPDILISMYVIIIPLFFFFLIKIFDPELAIGILLLTSMPAGVSTPALADIVKGNISLSMSLTIVSQLAAPFTVPLLFMLVVNSSLSINISLLFKDIAILVFLPLICSQLIKRYIPDAIKKTQHFFTSAPCSYILRRTNL